MGGGPSSPTSAIEAALAAAEYPREVIQAIVQTIANAYERNSNTPFSEIWTMVKQISMQAGAGAQFAKLQATHLIDGLSNVRTMIQKSKLADAARNAYTQVLGASSSRRKRRSGKNGKRAKSRRPHKRRRTQLLACSTKADDE